MTDADAAVDSEGRRNILVKSCKVLERLLVTQLGHTKHHT